MNMIKQLLEEEKGLSAWRITNKTTSSYELFFVHRNLETVRSTDTSDAEVTVYVDHDGKKGDSSFIVTPALTREGIKAKIASAVHRARLVFNEPYALPDGETLEAELPSNMKDAEPRALAREIADAVFAADTLSGGSINACEIFLYQDTLRVMNSRGLDKRQTSWRVMIEAIPTFTENGQSVELYEDYRFTWFDPQKITLEIAAKMKEVKDRFSARKPATPLSVPILFRPQEIRKLLGEVVYDFNYASVYSHTNLHKVGDDLQQDGDGDRLTVTMKARIEGSERSAYFDEDGLSLKDTCVIQNGIAVSTFGSSRYGQYLGVDRPTGNLRCLQAAPGSMSEADMKAAPYIECVSLSGLQLDLYNDYIGGEIRLAYYYDGEKTLPITGITMSGSLKKALASMRFSNHMITEGAYEGPSLLCLQGITVL